MNPTLLNLSTDAATWLRRAAFILAIATVLAAAAARHYGWLDYRPGGAAFTGPVRLAFLGVFIVGSLIAIRWEIVGGIIAFFSAAALIAFAYKQLEPTHATVVVAALAVPGLLWVIVDLNDQPTPKALLGIAAAVVAVGLGLYTGSTVYNSIWGPTHPESRVTELPESPTMWMWSGSVTTSGGEVRVKADRPSSSIELVVAPTADLDNAETLRPISVSNDVAIFQITNRDAEQQVFYAPRIDGKTDEERIGSFRTFPNADATFTVTVGACARVGSNGAVFDAIARHDPLLHLVIGDLHYGDIPDNDFARYADVLDYTLTRPAQAALYQHTPIAYVWDDHDYGANDSNAGSPSRIAAMEAYRTYVPSYELAGPDEPVYQAFTIGRVRFILTDARAGRLLGSDMWGPAQSQWFANELTESADTHAAVVWVNPVPWIAAASDGADHWGGYAQQRTEIADLIASHSIDNLVMVAGDAHMVAIDDGANTDYSTTGGAAFPLIHVAALDRPGGTKGGPYSEGTFPGGGQYATVSITDRGDNILIDLAGHTWDGEILTALAVQFDVDHR